MPESLTEIAQGYFRGRVLAVAARLGLADRLGDEALPVEQLAEQCGAMPDPLYRLLRALAAIGFVTETEPRSFALTEKGQRLRKDHPSGDWNAVVFWGDLLLDSWVHLMECMRTGKNGFGQTAREGSWSQDPEARSIFGAYFAGLPADDFAGIASAFDFSPYRVVADLGGAGGGLVSAVLEHYPDIRGMLVDREQGIEHVRASFGNHPRCMVVAADLLESVPPGADLHMLKNVLHGYADDKATQILRNCAAALESSGRVLVFEIVLPDMVDAPAAKLEQQLMSDINMLAVTGGRERSALEWKNLLAEAGLELVAIHAVAVGPFSIVEAKPRP